jgi:hypothetical protein
VGGYLEQVLGETRQYKKIMYLDDQLAAYLTANNSLSVIRHSDPPCVNQPTNPPGVAEGPQAEGIPHGLLLSGALRPHGACRRPHGIMGGPSIGRGPGAISGSLVQALPTGACWGCARGDRVREIRPGKGAMGEARSQSGNNTPCLSLQRVGRACCPSIH